MPQIHADFRRLFCSKKKHNVFNQRLSVFYRNSTGHINEFLPRRLEDIEDTKIFLYFSSCLRILRVLRGS